MAIVFLSLGSNLGDRVGYIQQATSLLNANNNINIISTSSFYETEPCGMNSEHWFVNAVIQISTVFTPVELLNECKKIENLLGRKVDSSKNGYEDRNIDIDILFYDSLILNQEKLVIPHPLCHKRAFTLVPMLEIAENYVHPLLGKSIEQLYDELEVPESVLLYGTMREYEDIEL